MLFAETDMQLAAVFWVLWSLEICEKITHSYFLKRYKTVPLSEKPTYKSEDVSLVIPTIDTESTFSECLRLWLASKPHEIIIVTVARNLGRVEELVLPVQDPACKVTILTAPAANKRQQLNLGIMAASGRIIALVDDDAYWRTRNVIPYLLAPFENTKVGAVAGLQSPDFPIERQDSKVMTVWEALGAYDLHTNNSSRPAGFAADGGALSLSGRTLFVRGCILQDEKFGEAFCHQRVGNKLVNGADDVFVTEWVFNHGWKITVQNSPEATVTTNVKRDHKFIWQILRWERGNIRSLLARLFVNPGFRVMAQTHPYTTWNLVELLLRPVRALAFIMAWLYIMRTTPYVGLAYVLWAVFGWGGWIWVYGSFLKEYPYCVNQIWGPWLMDRVMPLVVIYAYVTMNNDQWLTRDADVQEFQEARSEARKA
ncbi:polysaccharide synthase [Nemania sp. FL0916]|nr:polysaccharide synthase [Nemania sp. FL0916]